MKVNSQLERAQLETVTALPAAATAGRIVWNTVTGQASLDDATNYRALLRNDGKAIIGNSATASDNIRFHRGGAGVLQIVSGSDVTAEGSLSTSIAQLGYRAVNYATVSLPATGNAGRIAFDTTTLTPKFDNGSAWNELVDTSTVQTISGKTLTDPTFGASGVFAQIATPLAPSAGLTKIYSKSDGKFYYMASDGFEKAIGSGSGGGTNYVLNPDAESATTSWVTYADAAGSLPVDGTGGSPTLTFTRSVTTPLRGTASFLITKPASNVQGNGVSTDFTIDAADKAKVLSISFDYNVASGTYADNDLAIYIYDVTNAVVIQPSGYNILNAVGPQTKAQVVFQSASNSTSYRLILHCASTSAVAYTMQIDNVVVGPQVKSTGVPASDWVSYTPLITSSGGGAVTISGATVPPWGRWRRVGDTIEIHAGFTSGASAASGAAGNIKLSFPTGVLRETAIGSSVSDGSVGSYLGPAFVTSFSNELASYDVYGDGTFSVAIGASTPLTVAGVTASVALSASAKFKVIGWSSNVIASSDAETRVVSVISNGSGSHTNTGGFQDLPVLVTSTDTHAAMSGVTFTAPVAGIYSFTGTIGFTSNNSGIRAAQLVLTGLSAGARNLFQVNFTNGFDFAQPYADLVLMNAGDTARIQAYQNTGGALGYTATRFNVDRVSGPAQITATEVIAFTAKDSSTAATTSSPFLFTTVGGDTHGAYSSITGKFTAPAPGWFKIQGKVYTGAASQAITINVDGISVAQGLINQSSNAPALVDELLYLNAGQTVEIRPTSNVTATGGATLNSFSMFRLGGIG